jgi:hypothetical protein
MIDRGIPLCLLAVTAFVVHGEALVNSSAAGGGRIGTWAELFVALDHGYHVRENFTLSKSFKMTGYNGTGITLMGGAVTIKGEGAVLDAAGKGYFFFNDEGTLTLENMTMQHGSGGEVSVVQCELCWWSALECE